jgi:hypothetical protein
MQCPEPGGEFLPVGAFFEPPPLTLLAVVIGVKATRVGAAGELEAFISGRCGRSWLIVRRKTARFIG